MPGSLVFTPTAGPVDLRHLSQWWTLDARAPAGASPRARAARSTRRPRPPGRARRPRGRRGLRRLGRRRAADRGRVGVRRPRRPRGRRVHLGRRGPARRADHGEHLGRPGLPVAQHRRERVRADLAGRQLSRPTGSACSTWPATSGSGPTTGGPAATPTTSARPCCAPANPRGGDARAELRPGAAAVPDRPQGHQGRLAPVRRHLLPALPAGGPAPADDRHRHEPPRLPLCPPTAPSTRSKHDDDQPRRRSRPGARAPPATPSSRSSTRSTRAGRSSGSPASTTTARCGASGRTYVQFDFFVDALGAAGGGRSGRRRERRSSRRCSAATRRRSASSAWSASPMALTGLFEGISPEEFPARSATSWPARTHPTLGRPLRTQRLPADARADRGAAAARLHRHHRHRRRDRVRPRGQPRPVRRPAGGRRRDPHRLRLLPRRGRDAAPAPDAAGPTERPTRARPR